MLTILAFLLGAGVGAYTARKRGGARADLALYAVGYGVAFGMAGLVLSYLLAAVL